MSHPKELIDKFVSIMEESYSRREGYTYKIEERIESHKPLIYPDIQVHDKDHRLVSVVEIGYTRPEKIKMYRELGVTDIRWYSKAGELINSEEKILIVKTKHIPHEDELFYRLDIEFDRGILQCEKCGNDLGDWESKENKDIDILDEISCATVGELWCNRLRGICVYYCDNCDNSNIHIAGEDMVEQIIWGLDINDYHKYIYEHMLSRNRHISESLYLKNISEEKRSVFLDHDTLNGTYNRYIDEPYVASFDVLADHIKIKYDIDLDYAKIKDLAWDFLENMRDIH
jgi:hypothetical protein